MRDASEELLLTAEGWRRLQEELDFLRTVKRSEITQRIRESLDFGDAWENPEYEAAKSEQAFVEGRIAVLEQMLRSARLIETHTTPTTAERRVQVGSQVRLRDLQTGGEEVYVIVGSAEADPACNRISHLSPVAQAVLGRKPGETVTVQVPAGVLQYRVEAVEAPGGGGSVT